MTTEAHCLDEAVILELVQGALEPGAMRAAEGHLARCSECRELVSVLARSSLVGVGAFGARAPSGSTMPLASSAPYAAAREVAKSQPPSPKPSARPRAALPQVELSVRLGDVIADKYRVDHVLGVGGMGVVVAATHLHLGQQVALKFLLPAACEEPGAVARFLREGRAAVRIQSEHVARVTDVGTFVTERDPAGAPYMVMEFLRGTDLAEVLRMRGPLPIADAVEFVLQACEAIAEAHTLGIVHRDLKPANLFLTTRADGSPLVKVLDFGISKASGGPANGPSAFTTGEMVMGSPRYMSPEQMRSTRDVDARTDVWAIGVVLHELVTGRPAFEADTMAGLCALIATGSPTPLRAQRPNAPEALERAIARCLEKDPHRRMQSIAELAEALAPMAPSGARVSVERIVRLMRGIGGAATVLHAPSIATLPLQPTSAQPVGASTGEGFGRTASGHPQTGAPTRGGTLPVMVTWGVIAATLAGVAIGASFYVKRPSALAPTQAASEVVPPVAAASKAAPPAAPQPALVPPQVPAPHVEERRAPPPSPTMTVAPAVQVSTTPKKSASTTPVPNVPAPVATPTPVAQPTPTDPEGDVHRRGLLDRK